MAAWVPASAGMTLAATVLGFTSVIPAQAGIHASFLWFQQAHSTTKASAGLASCNCDRLP